MPHSPTDTRTHIRFWLNDEPMELHELKARDTLLDFIRLNRKLTGTKEGCAEGDCGACTVTCQAPGDAKPLAINACIRLLASVDGCRITTVEHVSAPHAPLHPVQQALVDHHGSQCGFCTPGIVMSLYALAADGNRPSETDAERALQGNLCRCTGYAPIIDSVAAWGELPDSSSDPLPHTHDGELVAVGDAFLPATTEQLGALLDAHPKATIVAGSTDVGLWVNKHLAEISPAIFLERIAALKAIERTESAIRIGARASYSDAWPVLCVEWPELEPYWDRIGGAQVRNMGTIGGNIANGSPIGDTPPVLIALDATLHLNSAKGPRSLRLEDFFVSYGKQDLRAGEFVEAIEVPRRKRDDQVSFEKVSKRKFEDISSVALGVRLRDGVARIALGGMDGIPRRASRAEAAFTSGGWTEAARAIGRDFTPMSDHRASAEYRSTVVRNLLEALAVEKPA